MLNDRLRQPFKPEYVQELGTAIACFAVCEWNAVYCSERIYPGAINKFIKDELTAGQIAQKLSDLIRNMPKSKEREELKLVAKTFAELVLLRNSIVHGKPCTGPHGEARISGPNVFEANDLQHAADQFSTCSIDLNRFLHGFLATYVPKAVV
jgi:hypothetical protein